MLGSIYNVSVQQADIVGAANAYAHNAGAFRRAGRVEAIEGCRLSTGHADELAARFPDQPVEARRHRRLVRESRSAWTASADYTGAQVYHMVAGELDVPPAAICMVAAHVWDTIGAQSIGCSGALVARPGNAPLPVHGLPQPQAVAPDLPGVAAQLIKLWR